MTPAASTVAAANWTPYSRMTWECMERMGMGVSTDAAASRTDGGPAFKERPILFSAPMVRAILDGRKTQTRRVVKVPKWAANDMHLDQWGLLSALDGGLNADAFVKCPFADIALKQESLTVEMHYQPGRRLWVRETWADDSDGYDEECVWADPSADMEPRIVYRADGEETLAERWRPSIHMPRWASRITLEVTAVRVERLCDITAADANAEGIPPRLTFGEEMKGSVELFAELWHTIHAADGPNGWAANPWVWVVEFARVEEASA